MWKYQEVILKELMCSAGKTLINQKAIEAPEAQRKWREFWKQL